MKYRADIETVRGPFKHETGPEHTIKKFYERVWEAGGEVVDAISLTPEHAILTRASGEANTRIPPSYLYLVAKVPEQDPQDQPEAPAA